MRTLVISDLHLGARPGVAVLQKPESRSLLAEALDGVDRLVLLGDVLELRRGPISQVLSIGREVLAELGAAMGADREVVIVPGNHDHRLLRPWRERRALQPVAPDLGLETPVDWREGDALAMLAEAFAPVRVRAAYPGVWLRDDVYAIHGHYLDRHITVPILERVGAGAMARVMGDSGVGPGRAEDYETVLAPMYDWIDAVAEVGAATSLGLQARVWAGLQHQHQHQHRRRRRRTWRQRTAAMLLPLGVGSLNRVGVGPLRADVSGPELRRAGLCAFEDVLRRLGVRAGHVIFGHTHRAGPLPGDDRSEWRTGAGVQMLNTGSWVHSPEFLGARPQRSPYRAGFAALVEEHGPPQLVNLVDERVAEHLDSHGQVAQASTRPRRIA